jgi:ubiquinone/menaquinone biosynthesis C-methylase UbiE
MVPAGDADVSDADASTQVAEWRAIWESTYADGTTDWADATLRASGWRSSYTGRPYSEAEMREWADETASRITARDPHEVLEIGCGTGMVLFRLAPRCGVYWATDVSAGAIDRVQAHAREGAAEHVRLLVREAADFSGIPDASFDAVVINSVVQELPSVEYLARVLEGAARAVRPGGFIFVGDIPNLRLLEMFHLSVESVKAPAALPIAELRQRVQRQLALERELVLDPEFFEAVCDRIPDIGGVEIELKAGRLDTEMNRFRYDVVLTIGTRSHAQPAAVSVDWRRNPIGEHELGRWLGADTPDVIDIRNVPNARLGQSAELLDLVMRSESTGTTGEALATAARSVPGIDPAVWHNLAEQAGYLTCCTWSADAGPTCFDARFTRRRIEALEVKRSTERVNSGPALHSPPRRLQTYATNPLRDAIARR